jgi:tetratricopeptide (TPR) repeat protein
MMMQATHPEPSPAAIEALYATGHWLYSRERFVHAQSVFRALIHIAPEDERGWLALGACHEALDQFDIALEIYLAAGSVVPTAPRCELARARILRRRGLVGEAREAFEEVERMADELRDDELRAQVAAERGQP